jgi:hypothetical protein
MLSHTHWLMLAGGLLAALSLTHSLLGERAILMPLFRDRSWSLPVAARPAVQSLLRFAWHLTTFAWLGMAATMFGIAPALAFGVVALSSGLLVFVMLRGHLAWPVFLASGLAALHGGGYLPSGVFSALAVLALLLATGVAALHVYWAFVGTSQGSSAVPSLPNGQLLFSPGPIACIAVAVAIGTLAAALAWAVFLPATVAWPLRTVLTLALLVLTLRAVGDGRFMGFSKRIRDTAFGRADDALYTPAVVLLWLGVASALINS